MVGLLAWALALSAVIIGVNCDFECHQDSDCQDNFCCSKEPENYIATKKRNAPVHTILPLPVTLAPPRPYVSSECRPMISENSTCLYVSSHNGDCGCAGGLTCRYFPERDTVRIGVTNTPPPYVGFRDEPVHIEFLRSKRMMAATDPMAHVCVPT